MKNKTPILEVWKSYLLWDATIAILTTQDPVERGLSL